MVGIKKISKTFPVIAAIALLASACNDRDLVQLDDYRPVTEIHVQGGGNIDVLWVIDNSGSMKEEQAKLADNFQQFVQFFFGLDYDFNMAVITTDLEDSSMQGRFQGPVMHPNTPDLFTEFAQTVNVGTDGNKRECGLKAAQLALSEPLLSGPNAGFLREDALLAVIVVTDEDDCGSEDDRPPQPPVSEYVDFFNGLKASPDLFSLSVIAGDLPNGCQSSVADAAPGYRYHEIVGATGGTIESICEEDFGPVLERLGTAISGFADEFEVTHEPADDTLSVQVDDQVLEEGVAWTYDPAQGQIQFLPDYVPAGCSTIRIDYWIPTAPGQTQPITIVGENEAFTCGAVEIPDASTGVWELNGGAIACEVSPGPRMEEGPTTWRAAAALAFLLALGLLTLTRRRESPNTAT